MRAIVLLFMLYAFEHPAHAHDAWESGAPVPAWVKASCCGPEDVHHLQPEQVHAKADGYHIDGISTVVPYDKALPSQDGDYWAFYRPGVKDPWVFCFFAPVSF